MTRLALAALAATLSVIAAPAAAQAPGLDPAFLAGRWSDSRECRDLVEYRADGTYRTSRNDQGRWSLVGNRLTMRAQSTALLAVRAISRNEIEIRLVGARANAVPGRSYRCRSNGRPSR